MSQEQLFNLLATAIILKEPFESGTKPQYLITQRSDDEKTFPGVWTVPGGHLDVEDITDFPKQTEHYWYNVIERALHREVMEEANIRVKNIWYLTSLVRLKDNGHGSMIISFVADYAGGKVKISEDMQDFAWVTYEEAKKYDLIDGILDEFYMIERKQSGERDVEWEKIK